MKMKEIKTVMWLMLALAVLLVKFFLLPNTAIFIATAIIVAGACGVGALVSLNKPGTALNVTFDDKPNVVRTLSGKVSRFGAYGSEFSTWYSVLLDGHPRPFRVYYTGVGVPQFVELTMPGDTVTLGLSGNGIVLTFHNPSLPR